MPSEDFESTALLGKLELQPLTARERRKGCAIRVVCCAKTNRFDDGGGVLVLYSVVVLSKGANAPHLVGMYWGGIRPHVVRAKRLAAYDGGAVEGAGLKGWAITEYAVSLPSLTRGAFLAAGLTFHSLSGSEREACSLDYDTRVSDAFLCVGYEKWLTAHTHALALRPVPTDGPLMSLVMPAYRTPPDYLRAAIASVLDQTYGHWELVVVNASPNDVSMASVLAEAADDARIRVIDLDENLGIVGNTNVGIRACTGDYVSFFDHDDVLSPHALAAYVRTIQTAQEEPALLYCDEDTIDASGRHARPLFKPSWNPDLLTSCNYVLHLLTVRRSLLQGIELSPPTVEGAQDYDLTLKVAHARGHIVRIPSVLYHWRVHEASVASGQGAKPYTDTSAVRALEAFMEAEGLDARVSVGDTEFTYDVTYSCGDTPPRLGVVARGTASDELKRLVADYGRETGLACALVSLPAACDASAALLALKSLEADLVMFVEGDVRLDCGDLLSLAGMFRRPEVFSVGPRVVREDALLDHAGILVRPDGSLARLSHLLPAWDPGYVVRTKRNYDAAVLSASCVLLRAATLRDVRDAEGFRLPEFLLADLELGAYAEGLVNVCCSSVTARLLRPRSLCADEVCTCAHDQALLLARHSKILDGADPSHSPNLDPWSAYYKLGTGN